MALLRYIGHASFELNAGGKSFLFDPWFSEAASGFYRLLKPACPCGTIKKVDFILVSHEHFDHCDVNAIQDLCSRTFAHVIAPSQVLSKINISQRLKTQVSQGDKFSLFGVDFEVTRASHPQSSNPVGFIVNVEENGVVKRIYFAGDTYDFYAMGSISCDVAILPIGGTFTMDELSAVSVLKKIKTKYVVPMHYNTFDRIKVDVQGFAARVKRDGKAVPIPMQVGDQWKF